MAKNFQVVLDFLVNLKSDKAQVEKLGQEIETILSRIKPELDFNNPEIKEGVKQIIQFLMEAESGAEKFQQALSSLDIDINTDDTKKSLENIDTILNDIDKKDLSELNNAFKEIEKSGIEKNIENLDQALKDLDGSKFEQEVENLAKSFSETKKSTEELFAKQKLALEALKANGKEGSEAYQKLEQQIKETEKELAKLGTTAETTSKSFIERMASFGLAIQGINQLSDSLNQLSQPFIELDTATQTMKTLGIEAAEMAPRLREAAITMSKDLPFGAGQIQSAMADALASGVQGGEEGLKKFAETASKLATGGAAELGSVVQGLGAVLNSFGESSEETGRYADYMFNIVNAGVTTIDELNASLSGVTPTAASMGVSFDKVGGALALLTQKGVPTAQAVTKLNALLLEMAKPSKGVIDSLNAMGVSAQDFQKQISEDFLGSLTTLQAGFEKVGKTATQSFSSSVAGAAFTSLMSDTEMLKESLEFVENTTNSTEDAYKEMSESIAVKTDQLKAKINAFFIDFSDKLGSLGRSVVGFAHSFGAISPQINSLLGISQMLPMEKMKTQIAGFSNEIKLLAKNLNSSGDIFKNLSTKMQESGGLIAKLGPAMMNPWVLGIGAAVAGLTLFLTKTDKGKQILERMGDAAKELWVKIQPAIDALLDAGAEVINYLIKLGELTYEMIVAPIEIAISIISELVNVIFDIVDVSNESGDAISGFADIFKMLGEYFKTATDIIQVFIYTIRVVKDFIIGFIGAIPELFSVLMDYAQYYLNPLNWFNGDEEYEKKLAERLSNAVSGAMEKAKNTIAESKMDFALQNAIGIKEDLDKNKRIDDLVEKFETAKSEIEKNNIAEEIAKHIPRAVNGYKEIIDENGKVIRVMDLSIEKVKEYTAANENIFSSKLKTEQENFTEALKEKAVLYQELSLQAEKLANEIVEGSKKGEDVSGIKSKYEKIRNELKTETEELSKTLSEGAKIDIEFDTIELPSEVEEQFRSQLLELRNNIKETRFDEVLSDAISIKKNLDEQDNIGKLVEKLNNAKTEIEKASIAEQIKKSVPSAVKELSVIQDKEGNLIKQYDIQKDKIIAVSNEMKARYSNEIYSKQEEYLKNLQKEEDAYVTGQAKLKELQAEINSNLAKGIDTKELEKSYNTINQNMNMQKESILQWAKKAVQGGIDANRVYEQIAKSFKISVEEAKKLIDVQKESKKITEDQINLVDKLAEAWSKATSELDDNIDKQLNALNELSKQLKNKALSTEERKKLQDQYNEELKLLKENVKEKKNIDKIDELNQIRSGLKEKEAVNIFELAKKEVAIKNKNLELEQKHYEFVHKQSILDENRKQDSYDELLLNQKSLETIQKQRIAWIEVLKAKKLIENISSEGEIIFSPKIKEPVKSEITSIIQDINFKIQEEQSKLLELKVKLKADDLTLQEKLEELEKKKIEWEISIGIKEDTALSAFVDEYKSKLLITREEIEKNNFQILELNKALENELTAVSGANAEQERERIRIRYALKLKEVKESNFTLLEEEFNTQQKIRELEEKIYQSRLELIKDKEEKRLQMIENTYQKQQEVLNKFNETNSKATGQSLEREKANEIQKINDKEKSKLAELEKWQGMNVISAETFEKKKLEIEENSRKEREKKEEEYRRKQLQAEAQRQGLELELQRRKDDETLNAQKDSIKEQLKLLEEKAEKFDDLGKPIFDEKKDREEYEALQKKLQETEKLLLEKGDTLGVLVTELQTTITDSLTNLFAADPEVAAENWRKFFSQLAGMLQAKASAFILDMVLSPGTMEYLSTMPFPTNVLAVPVITATINAAIKAITDPIISSILSFSTGGRIDQPTMAIIGDASRLGGRNREWIFNDSQLIATVQMAGANSNSMLIAKLDRVEKLLASQELKTTLRGSDIDISLRRTNIHNFLRKK